MSLSQPLRLTIALWLVVGTAVSIRAFVRPENHTVFPVLAAGAVHWWNDEPLYADYKPLDYFRYPPPFAVFLSPLAWLGARAGGIVWAWLNLIVYGAGLWALARRVLPVDWGDARLAVYLCLGLFGGLRGLWNGQSNALICGLVMLGAAEMMGERWWRAAFLFAGAISIKPTVVAPLLLLCVLWPFRLAPRFVVALAVFMMAPFLTRSPDVVMGSYRDWGRHLSETANKRWLGFRDAYTVWQMARELQAGTANTPWIDEEPLDSPGYRGLQFLTALAALVWSLRRQWRGASPRELCAGTLAMGMAWSMLLGPSVEHATYVLVAPFLCWAVLQPGRGAWRRILIGAAFLLVMVLGWGVLTRPLQERWPVLLVPLPIGTGLFIVWLATSELRGRDI